MKSAGRAGLKESALPKKQDALEKENEGFYKESLLKNRRIVVSLPRSSGRYSVHPAKLGSKRIKYGSRRSRKVYCTAAVRRKFVAIAFHLELFLRYRKKMDRD